MAVGAVAHSLHPLSEHLQTMADEVLRDDDTIDPDLFPDCRDDFCLCCDFANDRDLDHHVAYLDSFDRYSATNDVYLHPSIFTLSASIE